MRTFGVSANVATLQACGKTLHPAGGSLRTVA
jgi:hypothetical protein